MPRSLILPNRLCSCAQCIELPLLKEVLQLVIKQNRTRVSIQPKMDCVPEAISIIRELRAEAWCGFNDGNLELMSQVKQLAPEIPVFWDRRPDTDLAEDIRIAKDRRFEALVVHYTGLTAERVAMVKSAGFEAGAWTVNDPAVPIGQAFGESSSIVRWGSIHFQMVA